MAADEILDAAWAKEHAEVDRRVALAIAAHNQEDHARFRGLVTLGADFVGNAAAVVGGAHVFSVAAQSLATGGVHPYHFEYVLWDSGGVWSSGDDTRLTIPEDGVYDLWGFARVSNVGNVAGVMMSAALRFRGTGSDVAIQDGPLVGGVFSNGVGHCLVSARRPMRTGEYVQLVVTHNTGSTETQGPVSYGSSGEGALPTSSNAGSVGWPFDCVQFALTKLAPFPS